MKHQMFGLAAAAAVSLTLLTGCPAEEKKETTTTTTTTTTESAAPGAMASSETTTTTTTTESAAPAATASAESTMSASSAPAATASAEGTMTASSDIDAKALYAQNCAACHGATGGGGVGPALGNVEAKGDKYIHDRIVNGKAPMPAFGKSLSTAQIDALVTYVKSL